MMNRYFVTLALLLTASLAYTDTAFALDEESRQIEYCEENWPEYSGEEDLARCMEYIQENYNLWFDQNLNTTAPTVEINHSAVDLSEMTGVSVETCMMLSTLGSGGTIGGW